MSMPPRPMARHWAGACAVLAGTALASSLALAQDDPYAPDKRPEFSYPVERDYSRVFGQDPVPKQPWPGVALGDGPFEMESWAVRNFRAVVVARGFQAPRDLEILPDGTILITEGGGTLRMVRDGVLQPDPVPGVPPAVVARGTMAGLQDIALHPDFAENGLIYISYHKPVWSECGAAPQGPGPQAGGPQSACLGSNSIWRGRWTGEAIEDGEDIWVSGDVDMEVSALEFGADGKLYMSMGGPGTGQDEAVIRPQHPDDFAGKTVRLNDDGTVPEDNPFVGREGYNPEIFTMGHRNLMAFAKNPETGELWASEEGPNGGDEINIIRAGENYGWPVVSDGRWYYGDYVSESPSQEGMTRPHVTFVPSPALSGMMFYTGDAFPGWKNSLFVGSMRLGEAPRTGHLLRIGFNAEWEELHREMLLFDLHQRIRDVAQAPDGLVWVITAENPGVLMRLEPTEAAAAN
jgi:glucose/arabinose dehydrogenase